MGPGGEGPEVHIYHMYLGSSDIENYGPVKGVEL